jgi:hypothetical protein
MNFDEVIMKGAGCMVDRLRRWGKVHVHLRAGGDVPHVEVL